MPTQEDRIAALEQTMVSRIDFINAVNRLTLQQAHNASDMSHEIIILLGVTGSQGQDIRTIKEDVRTLKEDMRTLKEDMRTFKERFVSLVHLHLTVSGLVCILSLGGRQEQGPFPARLRVLKLETKSNEQTVLLTQILARLPER